MRTLDLTPNQPGHVRELPRSVAWLALSFAALCILVLVSGCVSIPQAAPTPPLRTAAPNEDQVRIYAPATTSSVPVVLATSQLAASSGAQAAPSLTIFSNHSQANTLFLRGDIDVLVTGLSVGVQFFRNGAPVQIVNCYVSGLTYLVTSGTPAASFSDLRGSELYVPFEGSPIEEASRFLAEQEGLVWKQDIKPVYAGSDSALALLKQGKASAVALPEPFVTLAAQTLPAGDAGTSSAKPYVAFSYADKWNAATGTKNGYPQVCTFVMKAWAGAHGRAIDRFNSALAKSIVDTQQDPAAAAHQSGPALGFEQETLLSSLGRTEFTLSSSDAMAKEIRDYYRTVGKPLDASYDSFFYR